MTETPPALFKFFAWSSFQYDKPKMFSYYCLHASKLWWCKTCWGAGIRQGVPSLHQEFKSVVVIKRFMSYLKAAGVSKVNRPLRTHFSAGAVGFAGVCFRKPDVCVWNLLFATHFFSPSHLHNICKLFSLLFSPRPHHSPRTPCPWILLKYETFLFLRLALDFFSY